MENNNDIFSCEKAKQMDLVDYLGGLGHHPQKIMGNDYWYLSPLRIEKTASFKINRIKNVWFDHGIGEGGTIIDLAIKLFDCTVKEFLASLSNGQSMSRLKMIAHHDVENNPSSPLEILDIQPLHSLTLLRYLHQRHIPSVIAMKWCVEVRYQIKSRQYDAVGFRNDGGGYELRNAFWKNSSTPKGITTINKGHKKVAVFEGFFDFLSFQVINKNPSPPEWNFCILNSLSFFEKSRTFLEQHSSIHLFLDNDAAGQNCSRQAVAGSKKHVDESSLYHQYKDVNEWLVMMGKKQQQSNNNGLSPML